MRIATAVMALMLTLMVSMAWGGGWLTGDNPCSPNKMTLTGGANSQIYNPARNVEVPDGVEFDWGKTQLPLAGMSYDYSGQSVALNTKIGTFKFANFNCDLASSIFAGSEDTVTSTADANEMSWAKRFGSGALGLAIVGMNKSHTTMAYTGPTYLGGGPEAITTDIRTETTTALRIGGTYSPKTKVGLLDFGLTYTYEDGKTMFADNAIYGVRGGGPDVPPTDVGAIRYRMRGLMWDAQYKIMKTRLALGQRSLKTVEAGYPRRDRVTFLEIWQDVGKGLTLRVASENGAFSYGPIYQRGSIQAGYTWTDGNAMDNPHSWFGWIHGAIHF